MIFTVTASCEFPADEGEANGIHFHGIKADSWQAAVSQARKQAERDYGDSRGKLTFKAGEGVEEPAADA